MLLYYQFIFYINLAIFNVVLCTKGQSSESIVKPLQETDGKTNQFDKFFERNLKLMILNFLQLVGTKFGT